MNRNLGNVKPIPKGQYLAKEYQMFEWVYNKGVSYVSLKNHNIAALTDTSAWESFTESGGPVPFNLQETVINTYADLSSLQLNSTTDVNKAYINVADSLVYTWTGEYFPIKGEGLILVSGYYEGGEGNAPFIPMGAFWTGNNSLLLNSNKSIKVNATTTNGYLIVTQDATGGRTLIVNGNNIDISTDPNTSSIVAYIVLAGKIHITSNANVISDVYVAPDTTPPTAPTVTPSLITNSSVLLTMSGATDNVGVTSYDVEKDGLFLGNTVTTTYSVTGLNQLTAYTFRARSRDAEGNVSAWSEYVYITTISVYSGVYTLTTPPTGFSTIAPGKFTITSGTKIAVLDQVLLADGIITMTGLPTTRIDLVFSDNRILDSTGTKFAIVYFPSSALYQVTPGGGEGAVANTAGVPNFRVSRTGTTVKIQTSPDAVTWTDRHTFGVAISGEIILKIVNNVNACTTGVMTITNS